MGYALLREKAPLGQKTLKPGLQGVNGVLTHCRDWKKYAANDESASGYLYITSDPIGLRAGLNTYTYSFANPIIYFDPNGLDAFTAQVAGNVPFVGGIELGVVVFNNDRFDIGLFCTLKRDVGGFALAKLTAGVSQTLGGRDNFDGTSTELCVGAGEVGGCIADFDDNVKGNESLSLEIGPQLGAVGSATFTRSATFGDLIDLVRDQF